MSYPYLPPPSVTEWMDQFALFLSKFGFKVTITIADSRTGESHTVERAVEREMKLDDLKQLAQAATPGPFYLDHTDVRIAGEDAGGLYVSTRARSDAKYIAALSPSVVLAMIECIEAADAIPKLCRTEEYDAARAKLDQQE